MAPNEHIVIEDYKEIQPRGMEQDVDSTYICAAFRRFVRGPWHIDAQDTSPLRDLNAQRQIYNAKQRPSHD